MRLNRPISHLGSEPKTPSGWENRVELPKVWFQLARVRCWVIGPATLLGMGLRLPSKLERPIAFAHRGARAHAPENTLEAFELAIKLGATGIESDVWLSKDGHLMLNHDGKVGVRRRAISATDRAKLPDTMISLPELFDVMPADIDFSIDIKDDAAMVPLLEWAGTLTEMHRARLYLCHHDWRKLAEWRELDPHVRLIDSTSVKAMNATKNYGGPERRAHDLAEAGIDGVNLRYDQWSGGMATLFHRFDRLCFGWDAQHTRVLDDLLRMGIDGLYCDTVDVMMDSMSKHLSKGLPGEPTVG